jgi:hypothetical protein
LTAGDISYAIKMTIVALGSRIVASALWIAQPVWVVDPTTDSTAVDH